MDEWKIKFGELKKIIEGMVDVFEDMYIEGDPTGEGTQRLSTACQCLGYIKAVEETELTDGKLPDNFGVIATGYAAIEAFNLTGRLDEKRLLKEKEENENREEERK